MAKKPDIKLLEHGTRGRYVQGCRCRRCRKANRAHYHAKRGKAKEFTATLDRPWRKKLVLTTPSGERVIVTMKPHCRMPRGAGLVCGKAIRRDRKIPICEECERSVGWNGLVLAKPARLHILDLGLKGIGYKAVAEAAKVAYSVVAKIRSRERKRIRASTLEAILAVPDTITNDASLVQAGPTSMLIHDLIHKAKMPPMRISRALGSTNNGLQILKRDKVTAKTQLKVEKLHRKVFAELEADPGMPEKDAQKLVKAVLEEGISRSELAGRLGQRTLVMKTYKGCISTALATKLKDAFEYYTGGAGKAEPNVICTSCGLSHEKAARFERLKKAFPTTRQEAQERWSCIYPMGNTGEQKFLRDMKELGARVVEPAFGGLGSTWDLVHVATPPQSSGQEVELERGHHAVSQEAVHVVREEERAARADAECGRGTDGDAAVLPGGVPGGVGGGDGDGERLLPRP